MVDVFSFPVLAFSLKEKEEEGEEGERGTGRNG